MKTRRLALLIATKRYARNVPLAMYGGYFTSMWVYPGSHTLDPLCLRVSSLALRWRRRPTPRRPRQRSEPERYTVRLKSSHTKANRSSSNRSYVSRRATAMASCAGVRVVRRQWGLCGYDPEHVAFAPFPDSLLSGCVAFSQGPRRFITRLNGRPYLWCCSRLAIKLNKHWCLPSEYSPALIRPEKAHNDEGYVNIRVGIHTQTGCLESFLQFIDWVF